MTGLNRITSQILEDAKTKADEIIAKAENEASNIENEAKLKAQHISEEFMLKAKKQAENAKKRSESNDELEYKRCTLAAKQEAIGDIIERAKKELFGEPTEEYFVLLGELLKKEAKSQKGLIILSERDKKAKTKDFEKLIEEHNLTVSEESIPADGGFILSYGGIEINCTANAVFEANGDAVSDMLNEFLFGGKGGV